MRRRPEIEADIAAIRAVVRTRFEAAKDSPLFELFCDEDDYIRSEELSAREALEAELAATEPSPRAQKVIRKPEETAFQCVLVGDLWHLTQEQANPPPILRVESWTSCAVWAVFKRGFERRQPTCPECLHHATVFTTNREQSPVVR